MPASLNMNTHTHTHDRICVRGTVAQVHQRNPSNVRICTSHHTKKYSQITKSVTCRKKKGVSFYGVSFIPSWSAKYVTETAGLLRNKPAFLRDTINETPCKTVQAYTIKYGSAGLRWWSSVWRSHPSIYLDQLMMITIQKLQSGNLPMRLRSETADYRILKFQ